MAFRVVTKHIKGGDYLYAVRSARVEGKPRNVEQVYLGKIEDLIRLRQKGQSPATVRTRRFGAVAAVWRIARGLGLIDLIDAHCPQRKREVSIGTYLTLAAINRVVAPASKRGFAEWFQTTSLPRLSGVSPEALTSQHFWEAMDQVPEATPGRVVGELARRVLKEIGQVERVVAFDCTNFFTWIDSGNLRSTLARRGHSKAHRYDLRQVGLALATTTETQIPLFHQVYEGSRPDVKTFEAVWPLLEERLRYLGLGEATAVYDGGNVSKETQREVDRSGIGYVTSIPPSQYPELLAQPLSAFTQAQHRQLQGLLYQRQEMKVLGRNRVVVQTYSQNLAEGQLRGVQQHLSKALTKLAELAQTLESGRRRRALDEQTLRQDVGQILSAQHLSNLVEVEFEVLDDKRRRLHYSLNRSRLEHLQQHLFGRRLWISNRQDWDSEAIILAARSQSDAEDAFRRLHAERAIAWSPMWHWTDQKVQVHGFYCMLGLLLVRLLQRLADQVDDHREPSALIADLNEVTECLLVYAPLGGRAGRPRTVLTLSETSLRQQRLLSATRATELAPMA